MLAFSKFVYKTLMPYFIKGIADIKRDCRRKLLVLQRLRNITDNTVHLFDGGMLSSKTELI